MKAELNEHGVMVITPETPTESYALNQWGNGAYIIMRDDRRMESGYWRGGALITNCEIPRIAKEPTE